MRILLLFFTLAMLVLQTSCSDEAHDLSTELEGKWVCISSNQPEYDDNINISAPCLHEGMVFFNSDFRHQHEIFNGKKAILCLGWRSCMRDDPTLIPYLRSQTVESWDESCYIDNDGDLVFRGEIWTLKGNVLTIIEADLDRFVGTVEINGDELTYNYKYEAWRTTSYGEGVFLYEVGPYTTTFKRL